LGDAGPVKQIYRVEEGRAKASERGIPNSSIFVRQTFDVLDAETAEKVEQS
jgi:hypothetical protein